MRSSRFAELAGAKCISLLGMHVANVVRRCLATANRVSDVMSVCGLLDLGATGLLPFFTKARDVHLR